MTVAMTSTTPTSGGAMRGRVSKESMPLFQSPAQTTASGPGIAGVILAADPVGSSGRI